MPFSCHNDFDWNFRLIKKKHPRNTSDYHFHQARSLIMLINKLDNSFIIKVECNGRIVNVRIALNSQRQARVILGKCAVKGRVCRQVSLLFNSSAPGKSWLSLWKTLISKNNLQKLFHTSSIPSFWGQKLTPPCTGKVLRLGQMCYTLNKASSNMPHNRLASGRDPYQPSARHISSNRRHPTRLLLRRFSNLWRCHASCW